MQQNAKSSVSFVMIGVCFILFITFSSSGFSFFTSSLVYLPSAETLNPYYNGEMMKDVLPAVFGRKRVDSVESGSGVLIQASYEGPQIQEADVTILIKTMDRPSCLNHLVSSIREQHPTIPIIIADDGKKSSRDSVKDIKDVRFYRMPYDSGLSSGRNLMISQVETMYVLLLDDDFLWGKNILSQFISVMERHPHLDLVGGRAGLDFAGLMQVHNNTLFLVKGNKGILEGTTFLTPKVNGGADGIAEDFGSPCVMVEFVPNFFLARTDTLLKLQWDNNLKVGEHEEFFIRFNKGGYRAAYCTSLYVENQQEKCNEISAEALGRNQNRARARAFIKKGLYMHNIAKLAYCLGSGFASISWNTLDNPFTNETCHEVPLPDACPVGRKGVKCDQCAAGFTGPQCDQCAPNHYGSRCVPCACEHGACVVSPDGNDQIVACECEKGWFGDHCDVKLQVGSNLILDPNFASLKSADSVGLWQVLKDGCITYAANGIWLMNDGFKFCGASYTVELNQEKPRVLVVSVEGKGVGVASVRDPLFYSLYYDVTYQDGTEKLAQVISFPEGTHGIQRKEIVFRPLKPIKLLHVYVSLQYTVGNAFFQGVSVQQQIFN
eukprot:Phypoly_transcript_05628.p1 GENE.Phypoly_transcript_05628~~Phypoly_transcript_05628.p1  ORF type:complete len:606 (-),score=86.45 Phypoly_transcript_05628:21-1838(-)